MCVCVCAYFDMRAASVCLFLLCAQQLWLSAVRGCNAALLGSVLLEFVECCVECGE